jgi:hypothetical protein
VKCYLQGTQSEKLATLGKSDHPVLSRAENDAGGKIV